MERLKKRTEFLHTAGGTKWASEAFVLQARRRADGAGEAPRTGFTASRKVGNAVARNRARRRLKEAARLGLAEQGRPGLDYVLVARRGALVRRFADILTDLDKAVAMVHRRIDEGAGSPGRPASGRRGRRTSAMTSRAT